VPAGAGARPAVAVVIPFYGGPADASGLMELIGSLSLRPGDELVVADNTEEELLAGYRLGGARVIQCAVKRSAYAARNIGAEASRAPWLLYLDADCRPEPGILDAYFDPPPSEDVGALAGQVAGAPDQPGLAPLYARSRRLLDQELLVYRHSYRPMGVTANLLVRRSAWAQIGGFHELTRSGADADFCWRLQEAGWTLEYRPRAIAAHLHRRTLPALLRQAARDGAGVRWLSRRWRGVRAAVAARQHITALVGPGVWLIRRRPRLAQLKAIDALWIAAWDAGSLAGNRPPGPALAPADTVVLLEEFPADGDPLVAELTTAAAGRRTRVEAVRRPDRPDWGTARAVRATVLEDDGPLQRAAALTALGLRSPRALVATARLSAGTMLTLRALAPAALRLRRDPPDARLLAPSWLERDARRLATLAGRPAESVEPLSPAGTAPAPPS
jgi:GT2 family glycosyltransferase